MKILVVCGAGASSTFVAHRLRRAAREAGLDWSTFAGTESSFPIDLESADLVLVGPQLAAGVDRARRAAEARGVKLVVLPADVFSDPDGSRVLALVTDALGQSDSPGPEGAP